MSAPAPPPLYAALCLDKPSSAALRASSRRAHLSWIAAEVAPFRLCGPLRSTTTAPPVGSLLLLRATPADTPASVARRLNPDPYAQAGLFASVDVREWVCAHASAPPLPSDLFVVWCLDRPGAADLRSNTRAAHLQWWHAAARHGLIGPFPAPDGNGAVGSLIICDGQSIEEVREWAKTDPYNVAGLFEEVRVYAMLKVVEDGNFLLTDALK